MKIRHHLHEWDLQPDAAKRLQESLKGRVRQACLRRRVRTVAGVDVGIRKGTDLATAAAVVLAFPSLELVEVQTATRRVHFPYVPGLLSFRECPALMAALECLRRDPDLILVDGQGRAHPRRFGIACHLGLLADTPTIGCAKSRLCGCHEEPPSHRGAQVPLQEDGKIIGAVVRTRERVKPLFISVGHAIRLDQAVEYVLACGQRYRLPEPARLAHQAAVGTLAG